MAIATKLQYAANLKLQRLKITPVNSHLCSRKAGWMIVAPMILDRPTDMNEIIELMHLRADKGIRLLVHDEKHPPQQAYKLSKAMMLAGIPVMVDEGESITEDTVKFYWSS